MTHPLDIVKEAIATGEISDIDVGALTPEDLLKLIEDIDALGYTVSGRKSGYSHLKFADGTGKFIDHYTLRLNKRMITPEEYFGPIPDRTEELAQGCINYFNEELSNQRIPRPVYRSKKVIEAVAKKLDEAGWQYKTLKEKMGYYSLGLVMDVKKYPFHGA